MNYIHLSPHFPPNYHLFAVNLHRLGVTVLGLADEPYDWLIPELKGALTEYFRVEDMHSYDQLLRACGYFTHKYGKLDRIESHTEYWLETEAGLRSDFNIPGPKREGIERMKRKSQMRLAFESSGVPVARGVLYSSPEQARQFVEEVGFPIVAKPDIGVGAANTYKIADSDDLESFIATHPKVDYLLEEFIQGEICTFDGLTDKDGNPVFLSSLRYKQGIMETVNQDLHVYYYTLRSIPRDLEDAGRRVLGEFDVRERFFHIEFFRMPNNQLIGLELNLRPPGGPTVDMWNWANEIDLYREWANIVVNNRFLESYNTKYHCLFAGRKLDKPYVHTHDQIMDAWGRIIVHHQPMSPAFRVAMGDYAYILRTPDLDEAIAGANYIHEMET